MTVHTEQQGPKTIITLDRPAVRNAIDRGTADALADAIRSFDADSTQRVAVLTGAGGTFCAGADLGALSTNPNRLEIEGDAPLGPSRILTSKPTIAAIAGHAVAGGLELACWCDLRIVEQSAVFGVFCRRWGVPLIDGGTVRLPRIIGLGRALDLILTGRPVGAEEAMQIGLATRVVPDGTSLQAALDIADQLCRFPQQALIADRKSAYAAFDGDLGSRLRGEFSTGLGSVREGVEGAARFARGAGRGGTFD